jgi:proteasome accessory factor C
VSRTSAPDRIRRLLAIVPWVAGHPEGVPVDEVTTRFAVSRKELLADLSKLPMVGVWPFTADTLVDVVVEDDRVWIHPQWFDRPLRLTPTQGLALVTAGTGLADLPGFDPGGPLATGLAKVAAVLGVEPGRTVEVELGPADEDVLGLLLEASRQGRAVELDYYSYGRDERSRRVVEPWRVYHDEGNWYLEAWCRTADGERVFRVDRISWARGLDEVVERTAEPPTLGVFSPDPDDPAVTLELDAAAAWVPERYPCSEVTPLPEGGVRVRITVTARPWLERLLVRLGPHARVLDADPALADAGRDAARRIRERYGRRPAGDG